MAESENEQKEDEQTEGEKKSPDSTEKAEEKKDIKFDIKIVEFLAKKKRLII